MPTKAKLVSTTDSQIKFTSIPDESYWEEGNLWNDYQFQKDLIHIFKTGNFVGGDCVFRLEEAIATRILKDQDICVYVVALSSGTAAIQSCLSYLKEQVYECPKQIVTSPITFWATTEAIIKSRLDVWYNDIDLDTLQIEPKDFSVPVALHGRAIPQYDNRFVVEDCCHRSPVSKYNECCFASCYSLFPSKPLGTCGDGGLVITQNSDLAEWIRSYRYHGFYSGNKNISTIISGTHRLSEINAAYAFHKLKYNLDLYQKNRISLAKHYCDCLNIPFYKDHDYHVFNIIVRDRSNLCKYLNENGVEYGMHYPYTCNQNLRNSNYNHSVDTGIHNARKISGSCLSLPLHPFLSNSQVELISDLVINNIEQDFYG